MFETIESKKLSELLTTGSFFGEVQTINNFEFFNIVSAVDLDSMLNLNYGKRDVFSSYSDVELSVLANFVVIHFTKKWDAVYTAHNLDIDLTADAINKTDVVETIDKSITGTTNNVNKVTTFNSATLIDDGSTVGDSAGDENTTTTNTETKSKSSLDSLASNLKNIDKSNIIDSILTDVSNYITVDIY